MDSPDRWHLRILKTLFLLFAPYLVVALVLILFI